MNGNVGTNDSRPWTETSRKKGFDTRLDNQCAVLNISSRGTKQYRIKLTGYGRQAFYDLSVSISCLIDGPGEKGGGLFTRVCIKDYLSSDMVFN